MMRLTYLFDPLCGWCYASAPAITGLSRDWKGEIRFAPTGLFAGEGARPLDLQWADYAWTNDQRIGRMTGQTFTEAYLRDVLHAPAARFDSTIMNRALTAAAEEDSAKEAPLLARLQHARYVEGRDTARADVVAAVLGDPCMESRLVEDDVLASRTQARLTEAQKTMARFGLRGVPQLLIEIGEAWRAVESPMLYQGSDHLMKHLHALQEEMT